MSPRTPEQFEELREERKNLIMDVALEQFASEGFHNTTVNQIAKHASISKGLLYNYFSGKEELLSEIIRRSVNEIYSYFDLNRDGYITEEEFEYFVLKLCQILKEKQTFWRLFFQLMMQNDVREQFLSTFLGTSSMLNFKSSFSGELFVSRIIKAFTEYFLRKKERKGKDYDPYLDLTMFIMTLKGFALTFVYMDSGSDDEYFNKTVTQIIQQYK